jgi:hypothetical protein
MKRIVIAFFLIAIALASATAINTSHANDTTTISIDSSTQQFPSATVGSTIQVNIEISNVQGLWAWDVSDLTFNPAYLNITDVAEGPFLKASGQDLFIWTSESTLAFAKGYIPDISDTLLEYSTASGSGVLATLTFKVLALGESQIAFNQTTLESSTNLGTISDPNYKLIPCTTINANIVVGPSASTGTPTSTPTSTHASSPTSTSSDAPSATRTFPSSSSALGDSPSPTSAQAPEFPLFSVLIVLIIASTISTLVLKKARTTHRKKLSFLVKANFSFYSQNLNVRFPYQCCIRPRS